MSILATCSTCQSKFKAPDFVAGRRTRCPRCGNPIQLPRSEPAPAPRPQPAPRLAHHFTEPPNERGHAWLLAGVAAGVTIVLVLCMFAAGRFLLGPGQEVVELEAAPAEPAGGQAAPEAVVQPPATSPAPPAPAKPPRSERLAALDREEKETLAALEERITTHQATLERLRKEEDDLYRKAKAAAPPPKFAARQAAYLKELPTVLPPIHTDLIALQRKRADLVQARRKLLFDEPQDGDPRLEDYSGLYLTPDEIADLGRQGLSAGSPRSVAQRHIQAAAGADTVARPVFVAMYDHVQDKDRAAVHFHVAAYRGRTGKDLPVHVVVHRLTNTWHVLELPGRNFSVIVGMPPAEYTKAE